MINIKLILDCLAFQKCTFKEFKSIQATLSTYIMLETKTSMCLCDRYSTLINSHTQQSSKYYDYYHLTGLSQAKIKQCQPIIAEKGLKVRSILLQSYSAPLLASKIYSCPLIQVHLLKILLCSEVSLAPARWGWECSCWFFCNSRGWKGYTCTG